MRKIALILALVIVAIGTIVAPIARANQSPSPSYCVPPLVLHPGDAANSDPFNRLAQHAEACPLRPGDIFSDGALFSPTTTFSGANFNVTVPANNYIVKGQSIYAAGVTVTVGSSATTYLFLDAGQQCVTNCVASPTPAASPGTSLWVQSTSATPPNSTSVLEYTIVSNGSGVTSVTNPPYANLLVNGTLQVGDITASNQSGHAGYCAFYDSTGKTYASPCPSSAPTSAPAGANFLAAARALGFTHAYTGASPGPSPAACASSQPVTDQIGANNLTGINSTQIMCKAEPIIKDGTSTSFILCSNGSSTLTCGLNTANYFDVPSAALPISTNLTECSAYAMDTIFTVTTALLSYDNADRIIYYPEGGTWGRTDIRSSGIQTSPFGPDSAPHFDCIVSNGTNVIVYHDGIMVSITANNPSAGPGGDGGWGTQVVSGPADNFQGRVQWLLIGPAMSQTQMAWLYMESGL